MNWEWKEEWLAYRKDNGSKYVLINKQLFGRLAVQFYESIDTRIVYKETITHDLELAKALGSSWLESKQTI